MRESKAESIARLVKLIETIHDVAGLLHPPAEVQAPKPFEEWLGGMRKVTAQFEFELRTELARLGADMSSSRHEPASSLKCYLDRTSEYYEQALRCNLTPHTRAMLGRQFQDIRKASDEFAGLSRVA